MENQLTYGQRAVGLSFNPSGNDQVYRVKSAYALIIDELNAIRIASSDSLQQEFVTKAILEAITAQMWSVKSITWN